MEIAYTYYKEGETAQAIQTADRFIRQYPNHPSVDYVYYLKGLASFDEDLGFIGRHPEPGHFRARLRRPRARPSTRSRTS